MLNDVGERTCFMDGNQANPLVPIILEIISAHGGPLSEYELMRAMETRGVEWLTDAESTELALFQKHFMVMNALYQLQEQVWAEGFYLSVSALAIELTPRLYPSTLEHVSAEQQSVPSADDIGEENLRQYYVNWENFEGMTHDGVKSLLSGFWKRYFNVDKIESSMQTLSLQPSTSWKNIEKRYRQLAAEHHPDRGGCANRFIEIRQAYEVLKLNRRNIS